MQKFKVTRDEQIRFGSPEVAEAIFIELEGELLEGGGTSIRTGFEPDNAINPIYVRDSGTVECCDRCNGKGRNGTWTNCGGCPCHKVEKCCENWHKNIQQYTNFKQCSCKCHNKKEECNCQNNREVKSKPCPIHDFNGEIPKATFVNVTPTPGGSNTVTISKKEVKLPKPMVWDSHIDSLKTRELFRVINQIIDYLASKENK